MSVNVEESGCTNSESQTSQAIKVYLRMKPFPREVKLTQEQEEAYKIKKKSTTLLTKIPSPDTTTSSFKRSTRTDIVQTKFTFTHIFRPETTQLELFDQAVKQQMKDFLDGQNSTFMTYGTTNSGKSYTLQGTTTSPGILPRCLEFVFSNISTESSPSYKPMNHFDVVCLGPPERAQEGFMKTKLLTFASKDKQQCTNDYIEIQRSLKKESQMTTSQCVDVHYSVWVSFAEIRNEMFYDLLSNENKKNRTPLKLTTDAQGTTFIKGLKTICVNSGFEAYQILMAGQHNLKAAATSSRSHCIFTIKLLKYCAENAPEDTVQVSTFTFCDLAGSERSKKTLNIGDTLKEARSINTSLLVLERCLKTMHHGQSSKPKIEHVGPFRESKLTKLFQKALSGKEHLTLIVNINPIPTLYVETRNVLNFAAIAKKIVFEQKRKMDKKMSRFSEIVTKSKETVTDWNATELGSEEWHNEDQKDVSTENVQMYKVSYIEDLKSQLYAKDELVEELKVLLNEAKDDYISATLNENMTENIIKEQKEKLLENEEEINDLKDKLTDVWDCLEIKTGELDLLEGKLENQNEKLLDYQCKMQDMLEQIKKLKKESLDTVTELNKNLEMCQDEKEHLQKLLDENNDKLLEFEDRLESAKDVEQEKDIEIKSLQEMENTIRELTEKLSQKEEYVEDLETCIKTSEQNAEIVELLRQSAQETQVGNERLINVIEKLKNNKQTLLAGPTSQRRMSPRNLSKEKGYYSESK